MTKYSELMKRAEELGARIDTEWAEEHEAEYSALAEACEEAYSAGEVSAHEFNMIICTGLYDYDGIKDEEVTIQERYQKAIRALGGAAGLLSLPEQVKDLLKKTMDLETKVQMLESIVSVKEKEV